jgi:hypothetical protein
MPGGQGGQHVPYLDIGQPVGLGKTVPAPVYRYPGAGVGYIIRLSMTGVKNKNGIVKGRFLPELVKKTADVCRRGMAVVKLPDFIDIVVPGKDVFQFLGVPDGITQWPPFLIPVYGDEYRPLLPHGSVVSQNVPGGQC